MSTAMTVAPSAANSTLVAWAIPVPCASDDCDPAFQLHLAIPSTVGPHVWHQLAVTCLTMIIIFLYCV